MNRPYLDLHLDIGEDFTSRFQAAIDALRDAPVGAASDFWVLIHPKQWKSVKEYERRWEWHEAWRAYRIARRAGAVHELAAHEVWIRYGKPKIIEGSVGRFEGIRMITSEYAPMGAPFKIGLV